MRLVPSRRGESGVAGYEIGNAVADEGEQVIVRKGPQDRADVAA